MSHSVTWRYVKPSDADPQHVLGASPSRGSHAAHRLLGLGWPDEPQWLRTDRHKPSARSRARDWADDPGASAGLATRQGANSRRHADRPSMPQPRLHQRSPHGGGYPKRERAPWRRSCAVWASHASNPCPATGRLQNALRARTRTVGRQHLCRPQGLPQLSRMPAHSSQNLEATQQSAEGA